MLSFGEVGILRGVGDKLLELNPVPALYWRQYKRVIYEKPVSILAFFIYGKRVEYYNFKSKEIS
jgi:hypothetical protein